MGLVKFLKKNVLQTTVTYPLKGNFEDDVPFPQVGYVFLPTRVPPITPRQIKQHGALNSYDVVFNTTEKRAPFSNITTFKVPIVVFFTGGYISISVYTLES